MAGAPAAGRAGTAEGQVTGTVEQEVARAREDCLMWLILSQVLLWMLVFTLGFLLMGTLRILTLMRWRLDQLEAITPSRVGRSGLKAGKKAPEFTLPRTTGGELALSQLAGRKVLLVFAQPACAPCRAIVPELNRVQDNGEVQVLVVSNGDGEATKKWAEEAQARFPVVTQERLSLSRRYEVYATPFAFLIDEKGVIRSAGIVNSKQYIGFVLAGSRSSAKAEVGDSGSSETEGEASAESISRSNAEEFGHA
jgi:methylamine dehydrogenase accessory protein MauD